MGQQDKDELYKAIVELNVIKTCELLQRENINIGTPILYYLVWIKSIILLTKILILKIIWLEYVSPNMHILPYLDKIYYFKEENINIKDCCGFTSFHHICHFQFADILPYLDKNNLKSNYFILYVKMGLMKC